MKNKIIKLLLGIWILGPLCFLSYHRLVMVPNSSTKGINLGAGACYTFYKDCSYQIEKGLIKTNCSGIEEKLSKHDSLPLDKELVEENGQINKYYSDKDSAYFYSVGNSKFYKHQNNNKIDSKLIVNSILNCSWFSTINIVGELI
ncbi:MAG: hypothetical protein ACO20H_13725 [Bacteriovoracaceae bacterium]